MGKTGWIILGLVILAVGVGSFFIEGISYMSEETVIDAGPLQVSAEREERIGLPMWLSGLLVVVGVVALTMGFKRPARG